MVGCVPFGGFSRQLAYVITLFLAPLAGALALWVFRATHRRWAAWDASDKAVSVTGCVAAAAGVLIAAVDVAVGLVLILAVLILHFVTI